ncbi:hypothetical protein RRG08_005935 [Elysia crispata]|uniref:Uncharacterized protein n=1 Tax=Elysia crispata TaxID=231223 RepID=A0AAE1AE65_9GAST|nr:hypothetical protein RRG08_005935 [Elysia crispata]
MCHSNTFQIARIDFGARQGTTIIRPRYSGRRSNRGSHSQSYKVSQNKKQNKKQEVTRSYTFLLDRERKIAFGTAGEVEKTDFCRSKIAFGTAGEVEKTDFCRSKIAFGTAGEVEKTDFCRMFTVLNLQSSTILSPSQRLQKLVNINPQTSVNIHPTLLYPINPQQLVNIHPTLLYPINLQRCPRHQHHELVFTSTSTSRENTGAPTTRRGKKNTTWCGTKGHAESQQTGPGGKYRGRTECGFTELQSSEKSRTYHTHPPTHTHACVHTYGSGDKRVRKGHPGTKRFLPKLQREEEKGGDLLVM